LMFCRKINRTYPAKTHLATELAAGNNQDYRIKALRLVVFWSSPARCTTYLVQNQSGNWPGEHIMGLVTPTDPEPEWRPLQPAPLRAELQCGQPVEIDVRHRLDCVGARAVLGRGLSRRPAVHHPPGRTQTALGRVHWDAVRPKPPHMNPMMACRLLSASACVDTVCFQLCACCRGFRTSAV
jgi:hypothetical protein